MSPSSPKRVLLVVSEDNHVTTGLWDDDAVDYFADLPGESFTDLSGWVKNHDPDIVHFQFLPYASDGSALKALGTAVILSYHLIRLWLSDYPIIWTVHHVDAHEQTLPRVDRAVRWLLLRVTDSTIVLDEGMKEILAPIAPRGFDPIVAPLGDYRDVHAEPTIRPVALDDLDGPMVGVIGQLREYKRVPLAIAATNVATATNALVIAGNPNSEEVQQEIERAVDDATINTTTDFGHIPDGEFKGYVEGVDCLLILNDQESVPATMHLGASFETPVVTTTGGVSEALAGRYNLGEVVEPDVDAIAAGIDTILNDGISADFESYREDHSWENYAAAHRRAYDQAGVDIY